MTEDIVGVTIEQSASSPEDINLLASTVSVLNVLMTTVKKLGYRRAYFVATNPLEEYVMATVILEDSKKSCVRFNIHYEDVTTYDVYRTTRDILILVDKSLTRIPKVYHAQTM